MVRTTDPLGETAYYEYDPNGNITQLADSWGTHYFEYDAVNRLTKRTWPSGRWFSRSYDEVDDASRVTKTTDARGNQRQTVYDELDRVSNTYNQNAGYGLQPYGISGYGGVYQTSANTFDAAGNTTASVDALGNATYFFYDALLRRRRPDKTGGCTSDFPAFRISTARPLTP